MQYRPAPWGCQSAGQGRALWWLLGILGLAGAALVWLAPQQRPSDGPTSIDKPVSRTENPAKPVPEIRENLGWRVRTMQREISGAERSLDGVKLSLFKAAAPGTVDEKSSRKMPLRGFLWNEGNSNLAGNLTVAHPGAGKFFWRAEKEGWATIESDFFDFDLESAQRRHETALCLEREARLQVRISAQGQAAKGTTVLLLAKGRPPLATQTDSAGLARWNAMRAGDYWLLVLSLESELGRYFWPETSPALEEPADFSIASGEEREETIAIEGNRPASLSGGVRVNGAPPQEKLQVHLSSLDRPRQFPHFPLPATVATVDSTGSYTLSNLVHGRARVSLHFAGSPSSYAEQELTLFPGAANTLDFRVELGAVRGQVVDNRGTALPQSRVVLRGAGERASQIAALWTDGEGRFRTGPMLAGEYELTVHPAAGASWSRRIRVTENELDLGPISGPSSSTSR